MFARLLAYARGLARRNRITAEVDEELQFHLEREVEAHTARGVPATEARRRALRDLGGLAQTRDAVSDVRRIWLDDLRQDAQYAVRSLRRSPGFAAIAVLTLTLGIGANTAIFSVVNAVLLRPLPYQDPGSLVLVEPAPMILSPDWATAGWRARAKTLEDFTGFNGPRAATLVVGGNPEQVDVVDVTANFLSFLGVPPAIGRPFVEEDSASPSVAILSHDFWTSRFGAAPGVLGTTITLGGNALTVIGVTSRTFRFPTGGALPASGVRIDTQPDVIRPARSGLPLNVIARLAPGATTSTAGAELVAIYKQEAGGRFAQRFLDRVQVGVVPLQERLVGDARQRLWLVMGAVGLVLLVACANVANLLLARASTRRRELAVRSALGARASRLARLLVTESLVLALIGSVGALVLTYWLRSFARAVLADSVPHVEAIGIDWWVLIFNLGIAAATGILCGLASLPGATRINLTTAFKAGDTPAPNRRSRVRATLLSAEVAVTFILVVGAALMVQTLWNLNQKEHGFDAERVLTVRVAPGLPSGVDRGKPGAGQSYFVEFFSDLTERIGRLRGVTSVAAVSNIPLAGVSMGLSSLAIEGHAAPSAEDGLATYVASVTPGYFRTMGTPIVAGRDFNATDRMGSALVAIVNDAFRRKLASGGNIVGSRVTYDERSLTVVGIVADVPERSLRDEARPLLFTPLAQMAAGSFGWGQLTLVVRSESADPRSIAPLVRREIWAVDRNIVIDELGSMDERIAASIRSERRSAWLFALFAMAALAIATIGVYGVAAYSMAQRTKEIGIRMALGAGRADVSKLVILQTLGPILAGIAIGLMGALMATRLIASRLYGVATLDPATFLSAGFILVSIALAASYVPARRAMTVDPLVALRTE
jgi:putative ABC transport system permease protein